MYEMVIIRNTTKFGEQILTISADNKSRNGGTSEGYDDIVGSPLYFSKTLRNGTNMFIADRPYTYKFRSTRRFLVSITYQEEYDRPLERIIAVTQRRNLMTEDGQVRFIFNIDRFIATCCKSQHSSKMRKAFIDEFLVEYVSRLLAKPASE